MRAGGLGVWPAALVPPPQPVPGAGMGGLGDTPSYPISHIDGKYQSVYVVVTEATVVSAV